MKLAAKEIAQVLHDRVDRAVNQVREGSSKHKLRGLARIKHRPDKGSPRNFEATAVTSKAMRIHAPGSKALSIAIASTWSKVPVRMWRISSSVALLLTILLPQVGFIRKGPLTFGEEQQQWGR